MVKRVVELWSILVEDSMTAVAVTAQAARLETDGWYGATPTDSQCGRNDVFVNLGSCVNVTTPLKLGSGTSNPAARHPAFLASAAAALQATYSGQNDGTGMRA